MVQSGGDLEEGDENPLEEVDSDEEPVPRSDLRLPSISRLQNASPSTASTSSTPSLLSTPSSQAALSNTSKSSSNSSFFSFSRRSVSSPARKEEHPLFVTWNTISSRGHKSLRGCIGTFDPLELSSGLRSYALTAYIPLPDSPDPNLELKVSVLSLPGLLTTRVSPPSRFRNSLPSRPPSPSSQPSLPRPTHSTGPSVPTAYASPSLTTANATALHICQTLLLSKGGPRKRHL